jgi:hypothetical protein
VSIKSEPRAVQKGSPYMRSPAATFAHSVGAEIGGILAIWRVLWLTAGIRSHCSSMKQPSPTASSLTGLLPGTLSGSFGCADGQDQTSAVARRLRDLRHRTPLMTFAYPDTGKFELERLSSDDQEPQWPQAQRKFRRLQPVQ